MLRRVLAETPGATLAFVGDGPERAMLEEHLAGLPVTFMVRRRRQRRMSVHRTVQERLTSIFLCDVRACCTLHKPQGFACGVIPFGMSANPRCARALRTPARKSGPFSCTNV